MPACTEWLIRAIRALAHSAKTVVDLFAILIRVLPKCLLRLTILVGPSRGIPYVCLVPESRINLAYGRAGKKEMAFGNNILSIPCGRRQSTGDNYVLADLAHHAMDRRV